MDSNVAIKVGLVAGSILTHVADERLLSGVDFLVTIQQRLAHEALSASRPFAGITFKDYIVIL